MPHTSQPVSLLAASTREVERLILSGEVSEAWVESVGLNIPYNIADSLLERVITQSALSPAGCRLGGLFTAKIKRISLDLALASAEEKTSLQSYISNTVNCNNLQTLHFGVNVSKKLPQEVHQILREISSFPQLRSLTVRSCSQVLSSPGDTRDLLQDLLRPPLLHLDISGASFDEETFKSLLKLKSLSSLVLDSCKLGTLQTLQLLTGLPSLTSLQHNYGKQSKVIQALSTVPDSTKLKLSSLTFRQPPRPTFFNIDLRRILPRLASVSVTWDIFEVGYSTAIDQGLAMLGSLNTLQSIALDITGLNMLYMIQLAPKIQLTSEKITRVSLTEIELLHPASLDSLGSLQNLQYLSVSGASVIGDDMFLELPELNPRPFPRLSVVEYSGSISTDLLHYLTTHSPLLSSLSVSSSNSVLDPQALKFCHLTTKLHLQSVRVELMVATSGSTFVKEIKKIIETSPNLITIGNVSSWGNVRPAEVDHLRSWIRDKNYQVEIKL